MPKVEDSGSIPKGMICMWSGSTASIPSGWYICDGNNGTPDLTDKFVIAAGNTYNVADTGGATTHTLSIAEMPSHNHGYNGYNPGDSGATLGWVEAANAMTYKYVSSTGGGGAHNNLPPYYALAYVMKS